VADLVDPVVELRRADDAALHRDVGERREPRDLADAVLLLVAVAVLRLDDGHLDGAALLEAGVRPLGHAVAQVDEEVELPVRAIPEHGHLTLPWSRRSSARRGRRSSARVPRWRSRRSSRQTLGRTSRWAKPARGATR